MTFINHTDEKDVGKSQENTTNDQANSQKQNYSQEDLSQWGYDLYPDRSRPQENTAGLTDYLKGKGKENIDKIKCERNVYKCIKESPLVKLMMGALRASGCAIDIRRHISCEECAPTVSGGYDPLLNQVVSVKILPEKKA
ncbi:hypothetical protein JTB14_017058 [Gonioctena quinquepunctata]|nr:hypothetical protein JTB14_017058 [Gonioctena quinquepunctata]